jgi:hypothetical protein
LEKRISMLYIFQVTGIIWLTSMVKKTRLNFPVQIRHFISWSPVQHIKDNAGNVVPSSRSYLEKMSVQFIKDNLQSGLRMCGILVYILIYKHIIIFLH